uniref:Ig-like domain-containing protein n=1 Tax=Oryzias latipes TaxID=8090 RepID=H2MU92_ORYLA
MGFKNKVGHLHVLIFSSVDLPLCTRHVTMFLLMFTFYFDLFYALVGNSTTFKTGINTPEPPEEILWKHNGNKMVEFDGQQQKPFNPFIDRITLNWHTAELTIANLKYEDSGDYDVEVFANKKLHPASFQLEVIDPVPKPSISCKINAGGNATLTCSAEVKGPYTKLEFSWTPPGNEKSSSSLEIKLGDKQDSQVYECKVKTQLSEEVSSFTAKDCYTGETSWILPLSMQLQSFTAEYKGFLQLNWSLKSCFYCVLPSEKNQHEIPSSPPQPPLKPSRSIVSPSRSQTHNKEGKVNGDAEEKGPESEPLPSEKTTDVEPGEIQRQSFDQTAPCLNQVSLLGFFCFAGSQQNQHEIISPLLTVPVEQHNTEDPHAKEAIKETEAKVSESAPSGLEQKTVGESSEGLVTHYHVKWDVGMMYIKRNKGETKYIFLQFVVNQDQTESSHPPPVAAKPSRASYINRVYKNPAGEEGLKANVLESGLSDRTCCYLVTLSPKVINHNEG